MLQSYNFVDQYIDHVFATNIREYKLSEAQRDYIWKKAEEAAHWYEREDLEKWVKEAQRVKK